MFIFTFVYTCTYVSFPYIAILLALYIYIYSMRNNSFKLNLNQPFSDLNKRLNHIVFSANVYWFTFVCKSAEHLPPHTHTHTMAHLR